MKLVLDVHNHTIASGHAYSTIQEYADEAQKAGLSLIAITDHAPAMPNSAGEFYFLNFRIIPREIKGVKIMMGVELNIMDKSGRVDLNEQFFKDYSPNIASFHYPCYKFSKDDMTEEERSEEITAAIMNIMDNPLIHILGHPGDPKYPFDIEKVVKKSLETGTLLEINNANLITDNSNFSRQGADAAMLKILKICKKTGCPIVLGSDAHFSSLTGKFEQSVELLKKAKFPYKLVANRSVDYFLGLLKA